MALETTGLSYVWKDSLEVFSFAGIPRLVHFLRRLFRGTSPADVANVNRSPLVVRFTLVIVELLKALNDTDCCRDMQTALYSSVRDLPSAHR